MNIPKRTYTEYPNWMNCKVLQAVEIARCWALAYSVSQKNLESLQRLKQCQV